MFKVPWPFRKREKQPIVLKENIDIDSLEIPINLKGINSVGDYENKRIEIAFAISCFYINHRNEYNLGDFSAPEYWLFLADEYLEKHGFNHTILHKQLETIYDVISKAMMIGLDSALDGLDVKLHDSVFEHFAKVISGYLDDDWYDECRRVERAKDMQMRERLRSRYAK